MNRIVYNLPAMRRMLLINGTKIAFGVGRRVESKAKRYVRKDTKNLQQSIETLAVQRGSVVGVQVGSDVDYARYVHDGTGIYGPVGQPIYPRHGEFLVFRAKDGTIVFARSVRGMRPNRYLTRALYDTLRTLPRA